MSARRLRFYGEGDLNRIKSALDSCVQRWADESLQGYSFTSMLQLPETHKIMSVQKWLMVSDGVVSVSYATSAAFAKQLAVATGWCDTEFSRKPSPLWERVVGDSLATLANTIIKDIASDDRHHNSVQQPVVCEEANSAWFEKASGYLVFTLQVGRESLDLVIDPAVAHSILGAQPAPARQGGLTPRSLAIANRTCRLVAIAANVELSIGELVGLSSEHIIRFDQLLDRACHVALEGGQPIAKAYLAHCQGRKAVQLAKL